MVSAVNNQDQTYKKPSVGTIIGGALAGGAVSGIVQTPAKAISPQLMEHMSKLSNSISADEFKAAEKAALEVIETTGLGKKGVSIIKATAENGEEVTKIITKEMDKNLGFLPKSIRKLYTNTVDSTVKAGKNALYAPQSKKVVMPENKLGLAVFHELGHAANHNLSKIGKVLQKSRVLGLAVAPISLIALWKTKKAPGEEPKNTVDKVTTFVKENAGKLTFAAFIPTLLEEGLATIKGNGYAKKLLDPSIAKKVAKCNGLGFISYLAMATFAGLGVFAGVKVKDAIAKSKSVEKTA